MQNDSDSTENTPTDVEMPTYREMFADWLAGEDWASPADPLVFHLRKLCVSMDAQIDENGEASGSLNSSYMQAWRTLIKNRPGAKPPPGGVQLDGQTSIFDEGFE